MPNFKEFIKGFEEKPEQPKTTEVKVEQPKPQTDYSKPYKTFGGKEHFIEPYTDFAGNKRFDIKTRKEGGEFDLGSRAGYDFKDEGEARKKIDEWEQYHKPQPKQKPSASSSLYKGVDIVSTPGGHFINDEKNSIQYSFETIDKAKEYIDNAEKAKGGMFDQSGLVTEKGKAASDEFKREKGIKNYYSLSNDQFNALAKEAMEKYGIKDFELAQEFLISNSQDDEDFNKLLEIRRKPKQGSFEQAFGDNQPREEFSQEDKAALVATYGAFPEEGIVARKLPNGNYLTNILSGADTEPEEVDEATLSKVFDELRGEKGFEEIINEWRENPNLIRERRNVQ